MKTTTVIAGLMAATLALTATHAMARGGHGKGPQATFEQLDADGSGEVTQAEMAAWRDAQRAAADTDGDGALSREEMLAAAEARNAERAERRIDRMIDRMDANGDGVVQFDEMPERNADRAAERFARVDTDGSGGLSEAEFDAAKDKRAGRKGKRGEGRDRG
ncbi:EF-hand domain-containing protein [Shimia ponticola]|uniref:EF-hand domain-containing protein n=1 Tax=Shimia ponticola TaxID=2582893 RepID=UPI0011BEF7A6|nr:EF-hand domain-containing protein [Shimia ponticola]